MDDINEKTVNDERFAGESLDPTFVPQVKEQIPHDVLHVLEALGALEDPKTGEMPETEDSKPEMEDNAKPMEESQLLAIIKQKIDTSHQWYGTGKQASERINADKYYRGDPLGTEMEGRSAVVSRDVAEAVDSAMPSFMRVFAGGDKICAFEPFGQEDEESAQQATDYINHVFMEENEGFMILYTWIKDALLKKNGITKTWHDIRYKRTKETYQGLTLEQLQSIQMDSSLKIESVEPYEENVYITDPMTGATQPQPMQFFNCVISCTKPEKKIRVENVPPDEFIIERRAVSIHTAGFLAQRGKRTISDLIECGFDPEKVKKIPRNDDNDYTAERSQRFSDDDGLSFDLDSETDDSMRKVWVTEAYIKCDYDGDGIAEWRQVVVAGDSISMDAILENKEVDDHPFADITPDPEPHKFYGQSLFDKTKDIQDIKTALIRGILDSAYLANSPRIGFVEGQVNLDDLLDTRVGGAVRMKRPDAIVPIPTAMVSGEAMQVVNYIDSVKEKRTGINAMASGLNPNILNSSATGADILNNNNQQRLELMCRIFAESGIKRLFRLLFKLVCQHQDVPRVVRLRNKWVTVNPRDWKDRMDVSATVGIGLGSKTQQVMIAQQLLQIDQQIIQMQGGAQGPIVTMDNVYNKLVKLVEAVGWKTPDPYYSNPKEYQPPPPPKPTPEQEIKAKELESKNIQAQASADSAKASALGTIETKRLDYEIRKMDTRIKEIELEALKFQSIQDLAQRADNKTAAGKVIYSKSGQRVGA